MTDLKFIAILKDKNTTRSKISSSFVDSGGRNDYRHINKKLQSD